MTEMTLRETQLETLAILERIDDICNIIGTPYYLVLGSLIGAVRHKGFIPWDDDLDIAMFPDDFTLFRKYLEDHDITDLEIHCPETKDNCFYNMVRICEKNHLLVFDNMSYTSGLFVDVYILEGMGKIEDLLYWKQQYRLQSALRKRVYCCCRDSLFYGRNSVHKILNLPIVLYSKFRGKKYFFDKLNDYKHFSIDESDYIGVPGWDDFIFKKKCFETIVRVPFENTTVNIPGGFDELLRDYYGNYMELPEESKRTPQHGYKAYRK